VSRSPACPWGHFSGGLPATVHTATAATKSASANGCVKSTPSLPSWIQTLSIPAGSWTQCPGQCPQLAPAERTILWASVPRRRRGSRVSKAFQGTWGEIATPRPLLARARKKA